LFFFAGDGVSLWREGVFELLYSQDEAILLDCAEGTLGQLIRLLGPQETSRVLARIQAIFISHPHADHMLGLPALLRAMSNSSRSSAVNIIAPTETNRWLAVCARRRFCSQNTFNTFDSDMFEVKYFVLAKKKVFLLLFFAGNLTL